MTEFRSSSKFVAPASLLKTLEAIDAGQMTPAQSIGNCLERVKACEPHIHAFASLTANQHVPADDSGAPLAGIALAVKDIIETADLPTEYNSPIYKGHQTHRDAPIVSAAHKAGCSLIGKSQTTEFAFLDPAQTRNPHNLDHSPGGSSSGSAAAVATGMAHLAMGTQTGGSIIRPASYCGVTGYKPSAGLLPTVGVKAFSWSLDTVGIFTAHVADAAFACSALTGRNLKIDTNANFDLPKLAVMRSHVWSEADPDYRKRFEDLLQTLAHFGVDLIDIEASDSFIAAFHAHQVIQDFEARQSLAWEYATHAQELSPLLKQTLDFAQTITPSDYDEARICAELACDEMNEQFEEVDAILTLSATGPAPKGLASTGSPMFNRIWTLFGLPAINVTGMATEQGLPLGVQLIGSFNSDPTTLRIAHWLEGAIARHTDR